MTTIRTRTRRQPPAVSPTPTQTLITGLLEQGVCTHRTDFDELERCLYLSGDPAHWEKAALMKETRDATEQRIHDEYYEKYGDLDERDAERLALRDLVRKLVEHMRKPLEITITLDTECSGNNGVERKDQAAFDELLEEADEVVSEYSVNQLEDKEKPQKTPKTGATT